MTQFRTFDASLGHTIIVEVETSLDFLGYVPLLPVRPVAVQRNLFMSIAKTSSRPLARNSFIHRLELSAGLFRALSRQIPTYK